MVWSEPNKQKVPGITTLHNDILHIISWQLTWNLEDYAIKMKIAEVMLKYNTTAAKHLS